MLTRWHKAIAVSQIVGGIFGIGTLFVMLIKPSSLNVPIGFFIYAPIIFGTALAAGILLWQNKASGYALSIIVQAIQALQISTIAFSYKVILGPQLLLLFRAHSFTISPGFYIASWIGISPAGIEVFVAINLLALIALIYLIYTRKLLCKRIGSADDVNIKKDNRAF